MAKFTAKMARFCEEYVVDFNATQAALRAGYSKKTAYSIGHENLTKPIIMERIRELTRKTSETTAVNAEYVRRQLVRLVEDAMPEDGGNFKHNAAARGLELLGRHVGFFEKDNIQQGQVGVPEVERLPPEARGLLKEALIEFLNGKETGGAVGPESGPEERKRVTH
jgi:phage terminase small subunit